MYRSSGTGACTTNSTLGLLFALVIAHATMQLATAAPLSTDPDPAPPSRNLLEAGATCPKPLVESAGLKSLRLQVEGDNAANFEEEHPPDALATALGMSPIENRPRTGYVTTGWTIDEENIRTIDFKIGTETYNLGVIAAVRKRAIKAGLYVYGKNEGLLEPFLRHNFCFDLEPIEIYIPEKAAEAFLGSAIVAKEGEVSSALPDLKISLVNNLCDEKLDGTPMGWNCPCTKSRSCYT